MFTCVLLHSVFDLPLPVDLSWWVRALGSTVCNRWNVARMQVIHYYFESRFRGLSLFPHFLQLPLASEIAGFLKTLLLIVSNNKHLLWRNFVIVSATLLLVADSHSFFVTVSHIPIHCSFKFFNVEWKSKNCLNNACDSLIFSNSKIFFIGLWLVFAPLKDTYNK